MSTFFQLDLVCMWNAAGKASHPWKKPTTLSKMQQPDEDQFLCRPLLARRILKTVSHRRLLCTNTQFGHLAPITLMTFASCTNADSQPLYFFRKLMFICRGQLFWLSQNYQEIRRNHLLRAHDVVEHVTPFTQASKDKLNEADNQSFNGSVHQMRFSG